MSLIKKFAAQLPKRWQVELKRISYSRQIGKNIFKTSEPEYNVLEQFISLGDWVVDIGANVGHYTKRFSELVGINGRVIAIEPIPVTFSLLAANVQLFSFSNVTLINAAISDKFGLASMSIPKFSSGLTNYYEAIIVSPSSSNSDVMTISLDSILQNQSIKLVKIDTEGHETFVLDGMREIIHTYRPILIIETGSQELIVRLSSLGYLPERLTGSPNVIFKPIN
jgi:FkbM family methyltransferase